MASKQSGVCITHTMELLELLQVLEELSELVQRVALLQVVSRLWQRPC